MQRDYVVSTVYSVPATGDWLVQDSVVGSFLSRVFELDIWIFRGSRSPLRGIRGATTGTFAPQISRRSSHAIRPSFVIVEPLCLCHRYVHPVGIVALRILTSPSPQHAPQARSYSRRASSRGGEALAVAPLRSLDLLDLRFVLANVSSWPGIASQRSGTTSPRG